MSRWDATDDVPRGDQYDKRWRDLEAAGHSIHGEADLIEALGPRTVFDAGCGTGRVAIELARRGMGVVGVDLDASMLETAREKAPDLEWVHADLTNVRLTDPSGARRRFDAVAMAGNVMIFVAPGTEAEVVQNLAAHLDRDGLLVAGFQLRPGGYSLADYDHACDGAGLELSDRWATWDREPYEGGDYAVSVHRRRG